jgi:DNA-binding SARP family transcriptional activator
MRGLVCASQAHYADAALHFAGAREQLPRDQSPLLAALDAFIDSHARYWKAQQALHDASHHFVLTSTDQEARLADLQEALAAAGNGLVDLPPAIMARPAPNPEASTDSPVGLRIACFGRFAVLKDGALVALCRNRNGQAILRYLAGQAQHRESVEVLLDMLWPDDEPDVARHKLHVAISALRQSLGDRATPTAGGANYVLHTDGLYELNPSAQIAVDVDEFERAFQRGQCTTGAEQIEQFTRACALYRGAFLVEDRYADWAMLRREQLTQTFLHMCGVLAEHELQSVRPEEASRWARSILAEDRCNEGAHRLLMRAYTRAGRRSKALSQYHTCEQVLKEEMGVTPAAETTALFYEILRAAK